MFETGFSELLLVFVIGLVVLGPKRLPVAVKTVAGWFRAIRSLASSVQTELTRELKMQELQDCLKKAEEKVSLKHLTPELKETMEELREVTMLMKPSCEQSVSERGLHPVDNTPAAKGCETGQADVTPLMTEHHARPEALVPATPELPVAERAQFCPVKVKPATHVQVSSPLANSDKQ